MRWLWAALIFLGTVAAVMIRKRPVRQSDLSPDRAESGRLAAEAARQRSFLATHGLNTNYCFLVDMQVPSGKDRFFVYDLHRDSIIASGLVAHGSGSRRFAVNPSFSNKNGSNCTSLGRYRIGYPYRGHFGRSYKLYGLDSSNSQAFVRNVVLHSFSAVPELETYPSPICNSLGCPMVSQGFLRALEPLIDSSPKPVCLCIFF